MSAASFTTPAAAQTDIDGPDAQSIGRTFFDRVGHDEVLSDDPQWR
jgi:hypothetical protein